jgi:ribosomal protein S27E
MTESSQSYFFYSSIYVDFPITDCIECKYSDLFYDISNRRVICKSCGLDLSLDEYLDVKYNPNIVR